MSRLKRLIHEIHRRSLWQVLLIYVGAAWACFELIDAVTERFGFPEWLPALAVVLFLLGLPFVVATACVHELPASAEPPAEAEAGEVAEAAAARLEARRRHRFLTWRNAAATFVIVLAAWGVVAAGWLILGERVTPEEVDARASIAVLPFVNLSEDPANEYFSDGVTVEIIDRLSKIADLTVKSRTSSFQYKDTDKSLREIGDELGVSTVVEGEVRRVGDRVRVNAQLIDADTDEHLWSEQYDRELTDVFAIQSDLAEQVATALRATLTPAERELIEDRPTDNLEAYDFYLRGKEYFWRPGYYAEDLRSAQRMWEQAVDLDPDFALAHAWLSVVHTRIYWLRQDDSEDRVRLARAAADRALELEPELPEAHLALGRYYYQAHREYDQALEELELAEQGQPSNGLVAATKGFIYRRQGRWEESMASIRHAVALDPRNAMFFVELGETHSFLRRYDEAERSYEQALAIEPEFGEAVYSRAFNRLLRDGDLAPFREYASAYPDAHLRRRWLEFLSRDFPAALAALSQVEDEIIEDLNVAFIYVAYDPKSLYAGLIHLAAGQGELARAAFDSARVILEPAVSERPDDYVRRWSLGVAYAGLGMKEAAVREGESAVALMPMSKDAFFAPGPLRGLAQVHTMVGDYDAAIDQLDYLLSIPSGISVPLLRIDPTWDPLRHHPRFQALLEQYE